MADMTDDDFYVDDETPEEFEAAWRQGERGATVGARDLDQRARSIVDQAAERLDRVETVTVETEGWFAPAGSIPSKDVKTAATV